MATSIATMLDRVSRWTVVRLFIGLFAVAIAGGVTFQAVAGLAAGHFDAAWAHVAGALAAVLVYAAYVRLIERRRADELGLRGALPELGFGVGGGAALVGLVILIVAVAGAFRVSAVNPGAPGFFKALAEMCFAGTFEELLVRGLVFRLLERSWGSAVALAVSAIAFSLPHLQGDGANLLSFVVACVAGLMFAAAYMYTRRLWLCIGLHIGWNFTLGHVFALAVSGHAAKAGMVQGELSGPAWLTGGVYGLEASVVTLLLLSVATAALLVGARSRHRYIAWRARRQPDAVAQVPA